VRARNRMKQWRRTIVVVSRSSGALDGDCEMNVTYSNVTDSYVTDTNVTDSNVTYSYVTDSNVTDSYVTE
jgi:hypothetical protein